MRVLVVEDEADIRDILTSALREAGFEVVGLANADGILGHLTRFRPQVLLLDQILPGKTGIEALREIRAHADWSKLPVIVVTGLTGQEDTIAALDVGADDYVTKPFFPRELAARIRAVVRRVESVDVRARIEVGELAVDFPSHRVLIAEREVPLTLTEFKILAELLREDGRVLTREKLRERALGNLNVTDRTIDVHMASLRKKLERFGDQIETIRGVGYRFDRA